MSQVELQTLQKLLNEMERSHGVLIEAKKVLDTKTCQLEIENAALREENGHSKCVAEVCIALILSKFLLIIKFFIIKGNPT